MGNPLEMSSLKCQKCNKWMIQGQCSSCRWKPEQPPVVNSTNDSADSHSQHHHHHHHHHHEHQHHHNNDNKHHNHHHNQHQHHQHHQHHHHEPKIENKKVTSVIDVDPKPRKSSLEFFKKLESGNATPNSSNTLTTNSPLNKTVQKVDGTASSSNRKGSFKFFQELDKKTKTPPRPTPSDDEEKFANFGRESYRRILKASHQVERLSSRRSARGSRTSSRTSARTSGSVIRRGSNHSSAHSKAATAAASSETETTTDEGGDDELAQLTAELEDSNGNGDGDGDWFNQDPFAADLPPPAMVSLTGDPRGNEEEADAAVDLMMAQMGLLDDNDTADVLQSAAPRKATPPPPSAASLSGDELRAATLINEARTDPAALATLLTTRRRPRHKQDGASHVLEFYYEGQLAHLKVKEGVAACDEAVAHMNGARAKPRLTFSQRLCDACRTGYKKKSSYEPTDALEAARANGHLVGASRQIMFRGKNKDITDVILTLLVDDGNSSRSRRDMILDETFRYAGVSWGEDGKDQYIVLLFCEQFSDN